jgi:hypothetical protein
MDELSKPKERTLRNESILELKVSGYEPTEELFQCEDRLSTELLNG